MAAFVQVRAELTDEGIPHCVPIAQNMSRPSLIQVVAPGKEYYVEVLISAARAGWVQRPI